jgi:hypothetical protein
MKTTVIFRQWRTKRDGHGVIALFPYEPHDHSGVMCSSYEHVGQHGGADLAGVISRTELARPEAYAALKRELESAPYGYDLTVLRRTPPLAAEARRLLSASHEGGNGDIQVMYPDQAERALRAAGRCDYQTGYGLPWYTYCGLPAPCPFHAGGPGVCASCGSTDGPDHQARWESGWPREDLDNWDRCEQCGAPLCDACALAEASHDCQSA